VRRVFTGGAFVSVAAIIATWIAVGLGGSLPTSSTCPLPAYPDASCTGIPAGTELTVIPIAAGESYVVSTPNAVVDAVDVQGCIDVRAPGVTVKNSRAQCITTSQSSAAENPANAPLTIQDSEVNCRVRAGGVAGVTGIYWRNIRAYRVDVRGCENGLDMFRDFVLQDSYVHDLVHCQNPDCPEPDAHTDGIQSGDGSNVIIEHNSIYGFTPPCSPPSHGTCNGTSAINICNSLSCPPMANTLIAHNLLAGGAATLYCPRVHATNFQIVRNHFSTIFSPHVGEFFPSSDCDDEAHIGNVIHETGAPVSGLGG
jgi:hypothetical protein